MPFDSSRPIRHPNFMQCLTAGRGRNRNEPGVGQFITTGHAFTLGRVSEIFWSRFQLPAGHHGFLLKIPLRQNAILTTSQEGWLKRMECSRIPESVRNNKNLPRFTDVPHFYIVFEA